MPAAAVLRRMDASARSCLCSDGYGRSLGILSSSRQACRCLLYLLTFSILFDAVCIEASRQRPIMQSLTPTATAELNLIQPQHQAHSHEDPADRSAARGTAVALPEALTATASKAPKGRSLIQTGYDPYGYGYYDPYSAGVTPGFVNVDVNRETGLHVDVGDVAVDVSADKNYVGLGVGKLLGVGAARDRGWNFQLGGGSVLDASVTKDAGLGLWVLDGLLNINIGPEGIFKNASPNNIAAQSTGAATPAQVTSVTVDDPAAQVAALQQQAASVTVNDPAAQAAAMQQAAAAATGSAASSSSGVPGVIVHDSAAGAQQQQQQQQQSGSTEVNPPGYSSDAVEVNPAPPADYSNPAAAAVPAPSPAAEAQLPAYDFLSTLDYHPSDTSTSDSPNSHARLAAPGQQAHAAEPPSYESPQTYHVYSAPQNPAAVAAAAAGPAAVGQAPESYLVARPAAPTEPEQDAQWSVASQYSDTQQMAAARLPAAAAMQAPGQASTQYRQDSTSAVGAASRFGAANPGTFQVQQQQQYRSQYHQPLQQQYQPQYQYQYQQQQQQQQQQGNALPAIASASDTSFAVTRRACDGGVQVWVDGNKFKCKYKRPDTTAAAAAEVTPPAGQGLAATEGPVKVASGQYTYANGVAV